MPKITALPEDTSPTIDDLIVTVNAPGTAPQTTKVTIANLAAVIASNTPFDASWDGVTTISPSKNAVYDQMILKANIDNPTFTTKITTPDIITKSPWVDVRSYASLSAAITAIGATQTTLLIPNSHVLTANTTIPSTLTLKFLNGGMITLGAFSLTINGKVEAGLYKIFSCNAWTVWNANKVNFTDPIQVVYPQWFGAVGDNVTDDADAFQLAFASAVNVVTYVGLGVRVGIPNTSSKYYISKVCYYFTGTEILGMGYPIIRFGASGSFASPSVHQDERAINHTKISGIKFEGVALGTGSAIQMPPLAESGSLYNQKIEDCSFSAFNIAIYSAHGTNNAIIKNNRITNCGYGIYAFSVSGWVIEGNSFNSPIYRPIEITNGAQMEVINNIVNGNPATSTIGIIFQTNVILRTEAVLAETNWTGNWGNVISGNTISGISEEGIMIEETVENAYLTGGAATAATSTTLTDGLAAWTPDRYINMVIWIASGTGLGQWRIISDNDATSVTITNQWSITPDATSNYVIGKAIRNNIISNNCVSNTGRFGIMLYGPCFNNSITGNTLYNCGNENWTDLTLQEYGGIGVLGTVGQGGVLAAKHPCFGNIIVGNSINGTKVASGIVLMTLRYINDTTLFNLGNVISNNTINSVVYGILIDNSKYTIVDGNILYNVDYGIIEKICQGNLAYLAYSDYTKVKDNKIFLYNIKDVAITGTNSRNLMFYDGTAAPTTETWRRGQIVWRSDATTGEAPGWVCTTSGTFSVATDNTGDTDGSTAIITGMTDTSDFYIGDYVTVSAGFATTGPYQILKKTSTTITISVNSDAAVNNITVSTPDPVFKAMANLA